MSIGVIIIITLIGCAFFSGLEIAFLTSNKLKIELESKQGAIGARIFSPFVKSPSRFISTMLLGNSISIVVYGIFSEELLEEIIQPYIHSEAAVFLLKTLISTIFVLIVAEYIPKALFSVAPNRTLSVFAIPFIIIYYLLFPLVWITMLISEGILKLAGENNHGHSGKKFGRIDLDNYVKSFSGEVEDKEKIDHEIQIFQNALEFPTVKIRECMIPRPEIIAIDVEESIDELKNKFISTGVSKVIVYRDTIDNVIGYAHSYEMFKNPDSIKSILLPVNVFPESMAAREVMDQLLKERRSIGVILDEFGGTAGMVTMEDVMEEIFGEIDDEHDKEELTEKQISPSEFVLSGRLEVDYLNEKYDFNLPVSDEYETLAGLLINKSQNIPDLNEVITIGSFSFLIEAVNKKRIEQVRLTIIGNEGNQSS